MDPTEAWLIGVLGFFAILGFVVIFVWVLETHASVAAIKAGLVQLRKNTGRKTSMGEPIYETIWVKPEDANKDMGQA